MSLSFFIFVALGGAIGATLRYYITSLGKCFSPRFGCFATTAVNVLGAFLIGFLSVLLHAIHTPWINALCITGILGGLTTFSSFSLDVLKLIEENRAGIAAIYTAFTLIFGFAALSLGLLIATQCLRLGGL